MFMLIIFIAIPIIEIALFIQVGGAIGLYPTLAIVLLTAILGTTLLKSQGLSALGTLQNSLQLGQNPMKQIIHGAMILISGVFLLTPGFFTDAFGILLLVPRFRSFLINLGGPSAIAILLFLALFGGLIILAQGSAVAPFIYAIF